MTSIYENIGLSTVQSNAKAASSATKSNDSLTQEDFLSLLTTQLSYQDPTKPVENAEMVSQLAQLNMVDSLATINEGMSGLSDQITSQQALLASSMVGTEVRLSSSTGYFDGIESSQFTIDAGSGVEDMVLTITDEKGSVVNTINVGSAQGELNLYWDGTDSSGNTVPAGNYTYSVNGKENGINKDLTVYSYGKVSSVTLGSGISDCQLNLVGGGSVGMNQVQNFG
jgi:flagellar basal-body rod modification protein FlgD